MFDYTKLDLETRVTVQWKTGEIKKLMSRTAQDIVDIGTKLSEVKEKLGHGNFEAWLDYEFEWSDRTARRFIAVSERFKSDKLSDLRFAPSALYLLSSPSTSDETVDEAILRAREGETITYSIAQDIVQNHLPEKAQDALDKISSPVSRAIVYAAAVQIAGVPAKVTKPLIEDTYDILSESDKTDHRVDIGEDDQPAIIAAVTEKTYERMMQRLQNIRNHTKPPVFNEVGSLATLIPSLQNRLKETGFRGDTYRILVYQVEHEKTD